MLLFREFSQRLFTSKIIASAVRSFKILTWNKDIICRTADTVSYHDHEADIDFKHHALQCYCVSYSLLCYEHGSPYPLVRKIYQGRVYAIYFSCQMNAVIKGLYLQCQVVSKPPFPCVAAVWLTPDHAGIAIHPDLWCCRLTAHVPSPLRLICELIQLDWLQTSLDCLLSGASQMSS